MNYKLKNKELIESRGRYKYYEYTEESIKEIVSKNVNAIENNEWRTLIQMLYPDKMIGSGLFQPILIFKIKDGIRIDPPIEAYDNIGVIKDGTCLFFRIIDYIEKHSKIKIDDSWYLTKKKLEDKL